MSESTRVLIIEDMAPVRQHATGVVKAALPDLSPEIIEASSGRQGIELFRAQHPDLILMDISMPDITGVAAAQEIWKEKPSQKIIFWSQHQAESYVRAIAKVLPDEAVHGYVLKGELDDGLKYGIQSVLLRDNSYIDPIIRGVQNRVRNRESAIDDDEYEILIDIILGLTDKAISERRHISVRAVQKRISSLIDKLLKQQDQTMRQAAGYEIVNPRSRCIAVAFKRGLVTLDELTQENKAFFVWLRKEFDEDLEDQT